MDASADLLKVNHRLESRVPEIGLLGSEGGATSSVVPTPIGRTPKARRARTAAAAPARHRRLPCDKASASNRARNPANRSATAARRASAHRSPAAEALLRPTRQRPPATARPISHSPLAQSPRPSRQRAGRREKWLFPETSSECKECHERCECQEGGLTHENIPLSLSI